MREKLHSGDVGVRICDAPRHQRARIGLLLCNLSQARHKINNRQRVECQPAEKGRDHPKIKAANNKHQRRQINGNEYQNVSNNHPHVTHGERRLHDLGGDAPGEFVLIKTEALAQHETMKFPAQQHREIARHRLMLK